MIQEDDAYPYHYRWESPQDQAEEFGDAMRRMGTASFILWATLPFIVLSHPADNLPKHYDAFDVSVLVAAWRAMKSLKIFSICFDVVLRLDESVARRG